MDEKTEEETTESDHEYANEVSVEETEEETKETVNSHPGLDEATVEAPVEEAEEEIAGGETSTGPCIPSGDQDDINHTYFETLLEDYVNGLKNGLPRPPPKKKLHFFLMRNSEIA